MQVLSSKISDDHRLLDSTSPLPSLPLDDYQAALEVVLINSTIESADESTLLSPRRESDIQPFTFPYGPVFQQFLPSSESIVRNAFTEVLALSYHAINAVCGRTDEFYRYFDERDANNVYNIFTYVAGYPYFQGAPEMARLPLFVVYGNRPGTIGDPIDRC